MREYVIENEFIKAVRAAGGVAYKLNSSTTNGLPDRLVLFFPAKCVFVELKAPGRVMRPLQRKRRYQLMKLGFPVLCIDRFSQIQPCIDAIRTWTPGEPFPEGIGAKIPELEIADLPEFMQDLGDYGDEPEPVDPCVLAGFNRISSENDIECGDVEPHDHAAAPASPEARKTPDTCQDERTDGCQNAEDADGI